MPSQFSNHGMIGAWMIGEEEAEAALEVVRSRSLFRHYGPALLHKATQFEQVSAEVLGAAHALAVNSGTSALRCALGALGLKPGDEVIVPPCTFAATANAVVLAGGVPVFAELDGSLGLDPDALSEKVTPRTVGVIPVHLQGVSCRIEEIVRFAKSRGLWVVEDCAQAFGASYRGRSLGTHGDMGVFSLQAHKTITCGEGGLVVTQDEQLYRRARRVQDQGGERAGDDYPSWEHPDSGFGENLKMSELHAAVALAQLRKLPRIRETMRSLYARLVERVELRGRAWRTDPDPAGALPYAMLFFARDLPDRQRIVDGLNGFEIPVDGLYDEPLYRSSPFVRWARGEKVFGLPDYGLRPKFPPCPRAEDLMARIIRIPLSPEYGPEQIALLADGVNQAVASAGAP
jgi:8-amino-3,8-dideoxy-alpha-D-manno-octulosonate transaminase